MIARFWSPPELTFTPRERGGCEHRRQFQPGDLLFVPAGCVHRFEEFSDDLAVGVVFYGPDGGEVMPDGRQSL